MFLVAAVAIMVRVNLPISVALVWITNPVTFAPIFYAAYRLGAYILGLEPMELDFELSAEWIGSHIAIIWEPLLLGCLIMGSTAAVVSFFLIRLLWRLHIVNYIKERKLRRKKFFSRKDAKAQR